MERRGDRTHKEPVGPELCEKGGTHGLRKYVGVKGLDVVLRDEVTSLDG